MLQAVATLPSLSTSVGSVGVTVTGVANVTPAGQLGYFCFRHNNAKIK